jgi:hypothetical protein
VYDAKTGPSEKVRIEGEGEKNKKATVYAAPAVFSNPSLLPSIPKEGLGWTCTIPHQCSREGIWLGLHN